MNERPGKGRVANIGCHDTLVVLYPAEISVLVPSFDTAADCQPIPLSNNTFIIQKQVHAYLPQHGVARHMSISTTRVVRWFTALVISCHHPLASPSAAIVSSGVIIISTIMSLVPTGTWPAAITCSLNANATGETKLGMRYIRKEETQAGMPSEIHRR